jgi:hypothetical protein
VCVCVWGGVAWGREGGLTALAAPGCAAGSTKVQRSRQLPMRWPASQNCKIGSPQALGRRKLKSGRPPPVEVHRFDVESEGGADCADVLPVEPLHDGRLAGVVQAAAGECTPGF